MAPDFEPNLWGPLRAALDGKRRPKAIDWLPAGEGGRLIRVGTTDLWVREADWVLARGGDLPCDVLLLVVFDGVTSRCEELRVLRRPDRGPVTTTALRGLPVDALVRGAMERRTIYTLDERGRAVMMFDEDVQARYREGLTSLAAREGGTDLERVAAVYRAAVAAGEHPTAAVERVLGLPNRNTAKKWVQRARTAGLLPAAIGERRGGIPPKSRATKARKP